MHQNNSKWIVCCNLCHQDKWGVTPFPETYMCLQPFRWQGASGTAHSLDMAVDSDKTSNTSPAKWLAESWLNDVCSCCFHFQKEHVVTPASKQLTLPERCSEDDRPPTNSTDTSAAMAALSMDFPIDLYEGPAFRFHHASLIHVCVASAQLKYFGEKKKCELQKGQKSKGMKPGGRIFIVLFIQSVWEICMVKDCRQSDGSMD